MASNRDSTGVVVRKGHTVHYGAAVGLVTAVARGDAMVRFISGVESMHACRLLTISRIAGRVKLLDVPKRQQSLDLDAPRFVMGAHP